LGTTDKVNPRKDTMLFLFALEPDKVMTMMDGLDELTGEERALLEKGIAVMLENKQAIVMSKSRLRAMNVQVGQRIKVHGMNYSGLVFEFDIIGELPDGKYEGVTFMNKDYLVQLLDAYQRDRVNNPKGEVHPMAEKCINLIWVRLPTKEAFERLSQMVNDPKNFNKVPIKLETASSGIGTWLAGFKDIFFGIKYIMVPAMIYGPMLGVSVAVAGSLGPALSAKNVKVAEVFAKVA